MKTILVSGASGVVGYGILDSLRYNRELRLIGTTMYDRSVAPAFCDIFELLPKTSESGYLLSLVNIIKKYDVDMIIPGIEDDMFFWNNHSDTLIKVGTFPLLNNSELIKLCADKWIFFEKLTKTKRGSEYAIPTFISNDFDVLQTPFLIKPIRGYGSKGIVKINDIESFNIYKNEIGSKYIMQPIVGNDNEEYSISAFFDKSSNMLDYLALKRKLSSEGFTQTAETVCNKEWEKAVLELADIFKPIGPTNFQFRLTEQGPKLLEINPRISSATSIRTAFGYNESVLSVEYFLDNKPITKNEKKSGHAVRYVAQKVFYDSNNS
jgi:carbamoyl-phosphate synthase large subunit